MTILLLSLLPGLTSAAPDKWSLKTATFSGEKIKSFVTNHGLPSLKKWSSASGWLKRSASWLSLQPGYLNHHGHYGSIVASIRPNILKNFNTASPLEGSSYAPSTTILQHQNLIKAIPEITSQTSAYAPSNEGYIGSSLKTSKRLI